MSKSSLNNHQDFGILTCCLENNQEPYIGVDFSCNQKAVFCLQHSSHSNSEGLMHQMMPLKQFKRTVHSKKFLMQEKVGQLLNNFNKFMDRLIEQIKELKIRKSLQLSMMWLRELADNEEEYQLMRKIYRMDFLDLTCKDIHSVYFKIIHNEALYSKQIDEINCYKGIHKVLQDLSNNEVATRALRNKVSEIEGLLEDGKLLKKVLPDKHALKSNIKEILLEEVNSNKFEINYHKAALKASSSKYNSLFSKYPIIPHTTYHISMKSKYSNIMLGVCTEELKMNGHISDLHYDAKSIVFNCSNGNTYKNGMYFNGSNSAIKGLTQFTLKLRLTENQILILTNKSLIMRQERKQLEGNLHLHILARTGGDSFEIERDKEVSADNLSLLKIIERESIKNEDSCNNEASEPALKEDEQHQNGHFSRLQTQKFEEFVPMKNFPTLSDYRIESQVKGKCYSNVAGDELNSSENQNSEFLQSPVIIDRNNINSLASNFQELKKQKKQKRPNQQQIIDKVIKINHRDEIRANKKAEQLGQRQREGINISNKIKDSMEEVAFSFGEASQLYTSIGGRGKMNTKYEPLKQPLKMKQEGKMKSQDDQPQERSNLSESKIKISSSMSERDEFVKPENGRAQRPITDESSRYYEEIVSGRQENEAKSYKLRKLKTPPKISGYNNKKSGESQESWET